MEEKLPRVLVAVDSTFGGVSESLIVVRLSLIEKNEKRVTIDEKRKRVSSPPDTPYTAGLAVVLVVLV